VLAALTVLGFLTGLAFVLKYWVDAKFEAVLGKRFVLLFDVAGASRLLFDGS